MPDPTSYAADVPNDGPHISGVVLLDQRKIVEEFAGAERLEHAIARLTEDQREEYLGIGPLSWCRVTTATAFVHALAEELDRDAVELQKEIVRRGIERTLTTIWRVLMRFTSDEQIVRRTAILYGKSVDTGSIRVTSARAGRAEIEQHGWREMTELDIVALATGIETVLRLAGREHVRVIHHGTPPLIHYVALWKA